MMQVAASRRLDHAAETTADPTHVGPAGSNRDLLPAPAAGGAHEVALDDITMLFQLMAEQRDVDASGEQTQIQGEKTKRDDEMRKMFESMRKQAAARSGRGMFASVGKLLGDVASNIVKLRPCRVFTQTAQNLEDMGKSPKFWADLTKGAALVAKVASAVIATATIITGPGAVGGVAFAAAAISLVCMAEGELKVLERCGVKGGVATAVRLGASTVTLAMGSGQALSNAASGASKAAQAAGQGAEATTRTLSTMHRVTKATSQVAKVLEPTARSVQAGSNVATAAHNRTLENHRADGVAHGDAKDEAQRDYERRVQESVEGIEDREKLLELVQQIMSARNQTTLSLASAIGGRA